MTSNELPELPSTSQLFPPSVGMRSYLSSHHLWSARHLARLAREIEDAHVKANAGRSRFSIRQRSYVTSAVFSAVAFLEAAINELFQDVADDHGHLGPQTRKAFAVYWKESNGRGKPLSKYQVALGLNGCDVFSTAAEPYQSAQLLVQLRNAIVHFTPENTSTNKRHELEGRLASQFPWNKLHEGDANPFWPDKCLGAGCAQWAVSSAVKLADEAFRRLSVEPNYQRVSWPADAD